MTRHVQDITDSMDWYNEQQEGLAERFYAELDKKLQKIVNNPSIYGIRYASVRCVHG